ncbi:hypothetical protein [Salinispira pacifica]
MDGSGVTTQPVFYLFIALSVLLSLGYAWGARRNKRILNQAFSDLAEIFKPKDQQFTNIGGLSGYHANFIPHRNRYIRRVDATVTLLPRQSWLYLPISRLIRRFDRLYMVLYLAPEAMGSLKEGHIIEKGYSTFHGAKIENESSLRRETITWGGMTWFLYFADEEIKRALERCMESLGEPGPLRHVALVPEQERMFLFMIPRLGQVKPVVSSVHQWFVQLLGSRNSTRAPAE